MKKTNPSSKSKCPIHFALEIIGDKWSLIIIRDIIFKEKKYYGEFLTSPEKISTNILADRLFKMETVGLISKNQDTQNLSKFIYQLTQKGVDLIPILLELIAWSSKYNPQPEVTSDLIKGAPLNLLARLEDDRQALISEIIANVNTGRGYKGISG